MKEKRSSIIANTLLVPPLFLAAHLYVALNYPRIRKDKKVQEHRTRLILMQAVFTRMHAIVYRDKDGPHWPYLRITLLNILNDFSLAELADMAHKWSEEQLTMALLDYQSKKDKRYKAQQECWQKLNHVQSILTSFLRLLGHSDYCYKNWGLRPDLLQLLLEFSICDLTNMALFWKEPEYREELFRLQHIKPQPQQTV